MLFAIKVAHALARDGVLLDVPLEVVVSMDEHQRTPPVTTSPVVADAVSVACAHLGLPVFHIPSGAAHDAQVLTRLADVG